MSESPFSPLPDAEIARRDANLDWVEQYKLDPDTLNHDVTLTTTSIFEALTATPELYKRSIMLLVHDMVTELLKYDSHLIWFTALLNDHLQPYAAAHPEQGSFFPSLIETLWQFTNFAGQYNPEMAKPLSEWDAYELSKIYAQLIETLACRDAETARYELLERAQFIANIYKNPYSINRVKEASVYYVAAGGQTGEAIGEGKHIFNEWIQMGNPLNAANFAIKLCHIYIQHNDLYNAREMYRQVQPDMVDSIGMSHRDRLRYDYTGGVLAFMEGHYEESLPFFEPLLLEYQALGNVPFEVAMTQYMIAYAYNELDRFHEARALLSQALETFTRLGSTIQRVQCLLSLSWVYRKHGYQADCETAMLAAYDIALHMAKSDVRTALGSRITALAKRYCDLDLRLPTEVEDEIERLRIAALDDAFDYDEDESGHQHHDDDYPPNDDDPTLNPWGAI